MAYFGIDCAQWQGVIDWGKVKKDGVKFAILKVTQKNNAVEKAFERNYAGCTKQGIPVGVYRAMCTLKRRLRPPLGRRRLCPY